MAARGTSLPPRLRLALALLLAIGAAVNPLAANAAPTPGGRPVVLTVRRGRAAVHAATRVPRTVAPPPAAPQATPAGASATGDSAGYSDPFAALGARSPFCDRAPAVSVERGCRVSGSIAHSYPLSSYGLDSEVAMGVTHVGENLLGALQDVAAFLWLALVYLVKGVLLMLEWAFSLDLVNRSMGALRSALATLHRDVIGEPWLVAALGVAGLWGIWRGLVQRRAAETLAGLASAVALMLVALVLIAQPAATVGRASALADDGALGVVAATVGGSVRSPAATFAGALHGVFDTTVLRPWAALEFGDPNWALRAPRRGAPLTNADVWLAFPAASDARKALYHLQKGDPGAGASLPGVGAVAIGGGLGLAVGILQGLHALSQSDRAQLSDAVRSYVHKDPSKVRLMEGGGTFPRLALLGLVAVGVVGAALLFLHVAVRLLLASIMSLLLLLLAPAMLLVPAFGASGRATAVSWCRRLLAALAAKLVYSLLLGILLVASSAIGSLSIGWFGSWLVLIAFWWGVLLKRRELVGFVSAGHVQPGHAASPSAAIRGFYALRLAGLLTRRRDDGPKGKREAPPIARQNRDAKSVTRYAVRARDNTVAGLSARGEEPAAAAGISGEPRPDGGASTVPHAEAPAVPPPGAPAAATPEPPARGGERVGPTREREPAVGAGGGPVARRAPLRESPALDSPRPAFERHVRAKGGDARERPTPPSPRRKGGEPRAAEHPVADSPAAREADEPPAAVRATDREADAAAGRPVREDSEAAPPTQPAEPREIDHRDHLPSAERPRASPREPRRDG